MTNYRKAYFINTKIAHDEDNQSFIIVQLLKIELEPL